MSNYKTYFREFGRFDDAHLMLELVQMDSALSDDLDAFVVDINIPSHQLSEVGGAFRVVDLAARRATAIMDSTGSTLRPTPSRLSGLELVEFEFGSVHVRTRPKGETRKLARRGGAVALALLIGVCSNVTNDYLVDTGLVQAQPRRPQNTTTIYIAGPRLIIQEQVKGSEVHLSLSVTGPVPSYPPHAPYATYARLAVTTSDGQKTIVTFPVGK